MHLSSRFIGTLTASAIVVSLWMSGGCARESPGRIELTPYSDVVPLLDQRDIAPPAELSNPATRNEAAWTRWIARHRTSVQERIGRGDEDSAVNLMLYGNAFTALPPATPEDITASETTVTVDEVLEGRLRDFANAVLSPEPNDRLRFAGEVLKRRGLEPSDPNAFAEARELLLAMRTRFWAEAEEYRARLNEVNRGPDHGGTAHDKVFQDRGLSSDTAIRSSYGVDVGLESLRPLANMIPIRRVAIIGPGLDFADKAAGHDFYPIQTLQPFAVVDSLLRHDLARSTTLQVDTFDVNSRVNAHLAAARERALGGIPYSITLTLERDTAARQSHPSVVAYWTGWGSRVGSAAEVTPGTAHVPAGLMAKAIRVRPDVLLSIVPRRLDVVIERYVPPLAADQFDVIIATNVLLYYSAFEQSIAALNIAAMLRPGGRLLTNHPLTSPGPLQLLTTNGISVPYDRIGAANGRFWYRSDQFYWYGRDP